MKKFWILLKKEIKELLTIQMILPLVAMVILFMGIGKIMGSEAKKQNEKQFTIAVIDKDKTENSNTILTSLMSSGYKVEISNKEITAQKNTMNFDNFDLLVVIPEGFDESLKVKTKPKIEVFSVLDNVSLLSTGKIGKFEAVYPIISETVSAIITTNAVKGIDVAYMNFPVDFQDHVLLNGKEGDVRPSEVVGYVLSQTTFIPIVLFLVITMASQLVATGMASEKENKTLETLLSLPIDRKMIVSSKLIAGGIVSLISSGLYLLGMQSYMKGISSVGGGGALTESVKTAVSQLGLNMDINGYILLGVSLFASILVALSIAFILGSFAKDVKSVQGVITPLMMLLLIPYLLSIFVDVRALPFILKFFVYLIPFTHTFVAASNIMTGHLSEVYIGIAYLLVIVVIGIFLSSKLFASEKILTISWDFSKKKSIKE